MTRLFSSFLFFIAATSISAQEPADAIFKNGKIYTVEAKQPWADSFAIKDGRFLAVGDEVEISRHRGDATKVVDLDGQFVMPGFIDAHIHPIRSQLMGDVDISISAAEPISPEQFAAKVKAYADANPDKQWLTGGAFSWGTFEKTKLNYAFIDKIISDRPVVIEDETGHIAIANSKALELAGVTKDTEDPTGGYFGRDDVGELDGLLYETAMQNVMKHSPNYTLDQVYESAKRVLPRLNSLGITGIKIAQGDHLWMKAVQRLDERGELTMQVAMTPYEKDFYRLYSNIEVLEKRKAFETDHFRVVGVKLFGDGVPFGRTMFIKNTYPGTNNHGLPMTVPAELKAKIVRYNGMGLSVMVHCTGDAAAELVLDGTEMSMQENGIEQVRALRNHIAHNVIVDPKDHDRMKLTNVVMEFSPSFWFPRPIIDQAESDLGPEMLQQVWPFGPTMRAGVNVAVGSDWNQAQCDPFINTETLVTRRAPGANESSAILGETSGAELEDVIHAYTMGGAYSMFLDEELGSIRPGKRANFIVLSQNLIEVPQNRIHNTFVRQTYFEGRMVYQGTDKVSF